VLAVVGYALAVIGALGLCGQPASSLLRFRGAPSLLLGLCIVDEVGAAVSWTWDSAGSVALIMVCAVVSKVRRDGLDGVATVILEVVLSAGYIALMFALWASSTTGRSAGPPVGVRPAFGEGPAASEPPVAHHGDVAARHL
jgi:hypothetical protein